MQLAGRSSLPLPDAEQSILGFVVEHGPRLDFQHARFVHSCKERTPPYFALLQRELPPKAIGANLSQREEQTYRSDEKQRRDRPEPTDQFSSLSQNVKRPLRP